MWGRVLVAEQSFGVWLRILVVYFDRKTSKKCTLLIRNQSGKKETTKLVSVAGTLSLQISQYISSTDVDPAMVVTVGGAL